MDFAAANVAMVENRSDVVDFMMPITEGHMTFAIKLPEENKNMIYFNIFDVSLNIF